MKTVYCIILGLFSVSIALVSFKEEPNSAAYFSGYRNKLNDFKVRQQALLNFITTTNIQNQTGRDAVREQINQARKDLKGIDFWLRYLEPTAYKKINGPLPVEWETEVFEKYEKPYKRGGAGLTLAALYLEEENPEKDSLQQLIQQSIDVLQVFNEDSVTGALKTYHHFYLCNRLFLLNLAAIYTTGFECPDTSLVIPELRLMLGEVENTYRVFNENFPGTPLTPGYLQLYKQLTSFAASQPSNYSQFDNFTFIKDYVNPLFGLNQQLIRNYAVVSKSFVDYSLNKTTNSIFSKDLYTGQNTKGIFLRVKDEKVLAEIDKTGKLLFYDPILSGNNMRSCNSCHKSTEYFNDTLAATALQFNQRDLLARNTPSLINAAYNHLLMLDGKHISLQTQASDVLMNPTELGCDEKTILQKVLSCPDYKKAFESLLQYTPQETEVTLEHITSAITFYYSKFSKFYSPFDEAMNNTKNIDEQARQGFNLFMTKAQCATCHFVPQFNGVKPPYVGSEFEVLGVPADTGAISLSTDIGRFGINPATETLHAFRTGSLRNAAYTKPYMHNGVFTSLAQVIDFYDAGGGTGKGLQVNNQTLSSDSLHLTTDEKTKLLIFMQSLNENILFEHAPAKLPASKNKSLNNRKAGGQY